MEKSRKPKIRFKGFTDDWEQRKLSDIYQNIGNAFVGTATPYYVEQGHFYLESNNIKNGQINHNSEVFINNDFYERQKDKWLHTGDMVMVQSGHVGHAAVIPEKLDNSAAHALIMFRNAKVEIEPYLLNYQYQTSNLKKKIDNITTGNTIKHILASDMKQFTVDIPSIGEQQLVANYFIQLDELITLHQRKLDKLINVKKSMLEKMFPKQGSTVPEIRFTGFTNDWEQRELGDIAPLRGGFAFKSEEYTDTGVPIIRISNILSNGTVGAEFAYYAKQVDDEEYALYDGAALLAMSGATTGKVSVLHAENTDKFYQNQRVGYFTRQKKYDYKFVSTIVRSSLFANQLGAVLVAGAQPNVSAKDIDSFEFMVPPQTKEQAAIGEYFCNLDNLITLHQCELEKLKNIKKSMLEKMFV